MNSFEIRQKFFDFFVKRGHVFVPSSPLIPAEDKTLLFANAGMNQFKDVFLGKENRSYKRAVSIQKCMRAGGKHNDLENVGFTARHLTFFEMMGNFSFGDYFKEEAIQFAWNFLTKELGMEKDRLYASVYMLDQDAYTLWRDKIGLPENRIIRLGEEDNFWQMGDTGPCGPCSEIYVDRGINGCGKESCKPGCSCDRFIEIWNLVFMQFNRQDDGTDQPLQQRGVDTGMGLERLCMIMQQKSSVFDIDLFADIIDAIERFSGKKYDDKVLKPAFRVLADHIRSVSFALADGAVPSNEGRGYVLRKIIRRAALFAQKLSDREIFSALVPVLVEKMGDVYVELKERQQFIIDVLKSEVERFSLNLVQGQALLEKYMSFGSKVIEGKQAFKLYDTYGFPLELTKVIALERGLSVDREGFEYEMENQRLQSGKKMNETDEIDVDTHLKTTFTGYDELETASQILAIFVGHTALPRVPAGEICWIITEKSPFYIESGGQISDDGVVIMQENQTPVLAVKKSNHATLIKIRAMSELVVGDNVLLVINKERRIATEKNHTATHLLQAALMGLVGKNIKQAGSLVHPDYLRFDVAYQGQMNAELQVAIEEMVNKKIMEDIPLKISSGTYQNALSRGVIAFFGEKYNPEEVRIVEISGFSAELCGGTHVTSTGTIGCFKIIDVSSLSSTTKRIVAVTGFAALKLFQEVFFTSKDLSHEYKVNISLVGSAVKKQRDQLKLAHHELRNVKKQLAEFELPLWLEGAELIGDMPFLYLQFKDKQSDELKEIGDNLIKKMAGFYFLVSHILGKYTIYAVVSPKFVKRISMKRVVSWLKEHDIQAGGSEVMAQGGSLHFDVDMQKKFKEFLRFSVGSGV
jgi:alanyl-tRNA synthetase